MYVNNVNRFKPWKTSIIIDGTAAVVVLSKHMLMILLTQLYSIDRTYMRARDVIRDISTYIPYELNNKYWYK